MTTTAKVKTVAGIDLARVSLPTLKAAYETTLKRTPDGEVAAIVQELVNHFRTVTVGKEVMECGECGGGSPGDLFPFHCPFCGSRDEEDEDASASPEPTSEAEKAAPESADLAPEMEMTNPAELAAPVLNGSNGSVKKTYVKPEPRRISDEKRAEMRAKAEAKKAERTPKAAMQVAAAATMPVGVTEADLDTRVERIRAARSAGAAALWSLSVELRAIYDGDLWKLRNGEDGAPKYKSFAKFLAEEVSLHERTVWRMIQVTREFDEADAKKFGVTILQGLLAAPKEDRAEILEKVDAGAVTGSRGVRAEVKQIRKRKGVAVVSAGKTSKGAAAAKGAAASAEKAAAEKKKTVTVLVPTGRKTVKLFSRSLKKTDAEKRAKRVADRPWGKLECANGVTLYFALVENGDRELELSVEARREE